MLWDLVLQKALYGEEKVRKSKNENTSPLRADTRKIRACTEGTVFYRRAVLSQAFAAIAAAVADEPAAAGLAVGAEMRHI